MGHSPKKIPPKKQDYSDRMKTFLVVFGPGSVLFWLKKKKGPQVATTVHIYIQQFYCHCTFCSKLNINGHFPINHIEMWLYLSISYQIICLSHYCVANWVKSLKELSVTLMTSLSTTKRYNSLIFLPRLNFFCLHLYKIKLPKIFTDWLIFDLFKWMIDPKFIY